VLQIDPILTSAAQVLAAIGLEPLEIAVHPSSHAPPLLFSIGDSISCAAKCL
jgi:hypothetical protein